MTTATFDTYEIIGDLQAAGFSEPQAKAVVDTVKKSFDGNVATKTDIAELRGEIKTDMKALQVQLMLWTAVVGGLVVAAIKYL